MGAQPQDKFILRLPDGLRDRVKAQADANHRSMNAELVFIVERALSHAEFARNFVPRDPTWICDWPPLNERQR